MQKVPTYIGIFCEEYKQSRKQISSYCRGAMQVLVKQNEEDEEIRKDLQTFEKTFQQPRDNFHITCLFIGGKMQKLKNNQKNLYKDFKENIRVAIVIDLLVYIPGYILCGVCSDTGGIQVNNKFPHITLYLANGAKAVQSNDVIETLMKKLGKNLGDKIGTHKHQVSYGKFHHIYTFDQVLKLSGVTSNNFRHGKK